jgi:hypothetical protein
MALQARLQALAIPHSETRNLEPGTREPSQSRKLLQLARGQDVEEALEGGVCREIHRREDWFRPCDWAFGIEGFGVRGWGLLRRDYPITSCVLGADV